MKSKSRIWEICFNASWLLDGCWEEHDRESQACEWNRTGDEWSYCLHFSFPFSLSMNCFIMIKDKTGINDTFTFSHQRETCLNLDKSSCGSGLFTTFSAGGKAVTGWYRGNMHCFFRRIMKIIIAGSLHSFCSNAGLCSSCFS